MSNVLLAFSSGKESHSELDSIISQYVAAHHYAMRARVTIPNYKHFPRSLFWYKRIYKVVFWIWCYKPCAIWLDQYVYVCDGVSGHCWSRWHKERECSMWRINNSITRRRSQFAASLVAIFWQTATASFPENQPTCMEITFDGLTAGLECENRPPKSLPPCISSFVSCCVTESGQIFAKACQR